ncbi:Ras guanine nucleotide exchange factor A [Pelomyxa schiedti]|nr:Ras guanine nucleotide exchange factor A [Pelomyxa schiedti]
MLPWANRDKGDERTQLVDKNRFLEEFFLCYREITTQRTVFDLLIKSFIERDSMRSPMAQEEQTRILHALKTWLSLVPDDFTENCPNALPELMKWRDCATTVMHKPRNQSTPIHSLLLQLPEEVRREICLEMRDLLELSLKFSEFFLEFKAFAYHTSVHPQWKSFSSSVSSQIFRIPSVFNPPVQYECYSPQVPFSQPLLELMEPLECAWHITCITEEIYRTIKVREYAKLGWTLTTKHTSSPNLTVMLSTFHAIHFWVCHYILSKVTIEQRVSALVKFIDLADSLLKINNLFSSVAVISGFNNSSLRRLSQTFAKLPKKSQKKLEYLRELTDTKASYRELRRFIHAAKPPCVPFLSFHLTDLIFISEGNGDSIGTEINFGKYRLISTVLRELVAFQQVPFTPPPSYQHLQSHSNSRDPTTIATTACTTTTTCSSSHNGSNHDLVQQMLLSTTHDSEEQLFHLSLLREPRRQPQIEISSPFGE